MMFTFIDSSALISKLSLEHIDIKGHIITTDALGTQIDIAKKIRQKRADYVLALKGNHPNLLEEIRPYFDDAKLLSKCAHIKTTEKAR